MNELYLKPNGVKDCPDERDFKFWAIVKPRTDVPEEILPDFKNEILNQGNTMRCTLFSPAGAINHMNRKEFGEFELTNYPRKTGVEYLEEAIKRGYSEINWWYIQEWVKLYRDKWDFTGYAVVDKTKDALKEAIASGKPICAGSNTIDWSKTGKYAHIGNGQGHAFYFPFYSKEWVIVPNSWGDTVHDRGYFTIKWEDIGCLFTCYALLDKSDKPFIMQEYAKLRGWWSTEYTDYTEQATRLWGALVIAKAYGVELSQIYDSGERITKARLTVLAYKTMLKKIGRKTKFKWNKILLKWELIELIINDLK